MRGRLHRWAYLGLLWVLLVPSASGQGSLEDLPILKTGHQPPVGRAGMPTMHTANESRSAFLPWSGSGSYARFRSYLDDGSLPPLEAVRIGGFANAYPTDSHLGLFTPLVRVSTSVFESPYRPDLQVLRLTLTTSERQRRSGGLLVIVALEDHSSVAVAEAALGALVETIRGSGRLTILRGTKVLYDNPGLQDSWRSGSSTWLGGRLEDSISAALRLESTGGGSETWGQAFLITDRESEEGTPPHFGYGELRTIEIGKVNRQVSRNGGLYLDNAGSARGFLSSELGRLMGQSAWDVRVEIRFDPDSVKTFRLLAEPDLALRTGDLDRKALRGTTLGPGERTTTFHEIQLEKGNPGRLGNVRVLFRESSRGALQSVIHPVFLTKAAGKPSTSTRVSYALAKSAELLQYSFWAQESHWSQVEDEIQLHDAFTAEMRYLLRRARALATRSKTPRSFDPGIRILEGPAGN